MFNIIGKTKKHPPINHHTKTTPPKKHPTYLKSHLVKRRYLKTLFRKGEF
jgi:hypothetical protein